MNCQEVQENLPLLLYGELSDAELAACLEHLAVCAACQAVRKDFEELHSVLAQRKPMDVSAGQLAEARIALGGALDQQENGWRGLWTNRLFRFQPASGFALALTFILFGFGIGWGLRPHAARISAGAGDVNNAGVAEPDLDSMRISGISRVAPDPQTGGVKITMDAERRVTLEGSMNDPKIQQVLVYAIKNYDNPGIRRDTLDALRNHADMPNIRQALIYAMQHDSNAGVRLEALGAVRNMTSETDVHAALLNALQHDSNAGIRVAAVDALIHDGDEEINDQPTTDALAHLASTDSNPYIRLKCASAVMKTGK